MGFWAGLFSDKSKLGKLKTQKLDKIGILLILVNIWIGFNQQKNGFDPRREKLHLEDSEG